MGIINKWLRSICICHALRYRTAAVAAEGRFQNEIRFHEQTRMDADEALQEAYKKIHWLQAENLHLRQPDLEQHIWKKAIQEAERVQQSKTESIRSKLLKLPGMSDEKIRDAARFGVVQEEDGWAICEQFCQLGGCDIVGSKRYNSELDALIHAYIRTCFGEKQKTGGACSECYAEYIKDCI